MLGNMTKKSLEKLQAILSHEAKWRDYEFARTTQRLRKRLDNPKRFWSAARITEGIEAIHSAMADFGHFAFEQIERGPRSSEHIQIACDAVEEFWDHLNGRVPMIVWPPDGNPIAGCEEIEAEARIDIARVSRSVDGLIDQLKQARLDKPRAAKESTTDWGNLAEPPLDPLPLWLNMYQAAAWVVFRMDRAMVNLNRASLLHAEIRYSDLKQIGNLDEFELALQAGHPVAEGPFGESGSTAPVPKSAWTAMSAAPLYPDNDAPYRDIKIRRYILESAFPTLATLATRKRRSKPKLPSVQLCKWFDGLGDLQFQAQSTLYRLAVRDFPEFRVTHAEIRALTPGRLRGRKAKFKIRTSDLSPNSTS